MTWTLLECLSYVEKSKKKVVNNDAKILSFIQGQPGLGIDNQQLLQFLNAEFQMRFCIHYIPLVCATTLHDIVFLEVEHISLSSTEGLGGHGEAT